jgi:hypothetical protein
MIATESMRLATSKLRRSVVRAGPVVVALLLGIATVTSAALSYRDVQVSSAAVAELQGIAFLHRTERAIEHQPGGGTALERHRLRALQEIVNAPTPTRLEEARPPSCQPLPVRERPASPTSIHPRTLNSTRNRSCALVQAATASAARRPSKGAGPCVTTASLRLAGRSAHEAITSPRITSGVTIGPAPSPLEACETAAPLRSKNMPA